MEEFVGSRAKICSHLIDDGSEDKKSKARKKCVIKRKPKFQDYKNCLAAAQIDNKRKHLEKSKIEVDSLKEDHK